MLASTFALDRRVELFVSHDMNPTEVRQYRIERLVSYDNGETWVDNWIRNDVGAFSSSAAACITGDSLDTFICGRGLDDKVWFARLAEYYDFVHQGFGPVGNGIFSGAPAMCVQGSSGSTWPSTSSGQRQTTYDGVRVALFGKGTDERFWWAVSNSGGNQWDMAWKAIANGKFISGPAACCSADGKLMAVFGQGKDKKIWWAFTTSGGNKWEMAWAPIGAGEFTSRPAACCSADGKRVYVFGKGKDNRIWWACTSRGTAGWDMAWQPIGLGVFTSSPAASCSWDGRTIHVFGRGKDNRIWQARSFDFGATWNIAWRKVNAKKFLNLNIDL